MSNQTKLRLEILRCPVHGYWAIGLESTRLTNAKCCGRWETVKEFRVPADRLIKDVEAVL